MHCSYTEMAPNTLKCLQLASSFEIFSRGTTPAPPPLPWPPHLQSRCDGPDVDQVENELVAGLLYSKGTSGFTGQHHLLWPALTKHPKYVSSSTYTHKLMKCIEFTLVIIAWKMQYFKVYFNLRGYILLVSCRLCHCMRKQ